MKSSIDVISDFWRHLTPQITWGMAIADEISRIPRKKFANKGRVSTEHYGKARSGFQIRIIYSPGGVFVAVELNFLNNSKTVRIGRRCQQTTCRNLGFGLWPLGVTSAQPNWMHANYSGIIRDRQKVSTEWTHYLQEVGIRLSIL